MIIYLTPADDPAVEPFPFDLRPANCLSAPGHIKHFSQNFTPCG